MSLIEHQINTILYEKTKEDNQSWVVQMFPEEGEIISPEGVPQRVIIPTSVPKQVIKAIDVTGLNTQDRQQMLERWHAYQEYRSAIMKTIFSFENFVDHTYGTDENAIPPKWRSFSPSKIRSFPEM